MKATIWIIGVVVVLIIAVIAVNLTLTTTEIEPIRIGAVTPMTGAASGYGEPAGKGLLLAEEHLNAAGGILGRPVKLILEDGQCNSKESVVAAQKLIFNDKVKVILGGHCSTESLAIAPLANENRILQLATMTSSALYTGAGDYSFRNYPKSSLYNGQIADVAYSQGARKMALLYEQLAFPISAYESVASRFEELGGTVVDVQSFTERETDMRSYVLKFPVEADSVYFASQGDDVAATFFQQMKELGRLDDFRIYTSSQGVTQKVFDLTGGLNKDVYTTDVYVNPEMPRTKALLDAYSLKYGSYPETNYYFVASSYDSLYIIKEAAESCGAFEVECMKEYLYGLQDWEGSSGKLSFDENGDAITTIGLHYFDDAGEVWEVLE